MSSRVLQLGTAMFRPQTDGGKSRPPMGGVQRQAMRAGRRNSGGGGASERSTRRRDAEGVRARGPPRTPVPVASTGGREPVPCHTDSAQAAQADFSSSTFIECAPVAAGTWYARGRTCFFSLSLDFVTDECRVRSRPFPATFNNLRKSKKSVEPWSFWREMC